MAKNLFNEEIHTAKRSMRDFFIVPPFSVLDTTESSWMRRRKRWLKITGNLSDSRDGEFGTIGGADGDSLLSKINGGTSNFDPVLAEIIMKWFGLPGGRILDPFGGEQTKGIVAGELGFNYDAVEFRNEQVIINHIKCIKYRGVKYRRGDSNDISKIITGRDFDLCFTSPPYYDLEVYSADDMSALGTYAEFMKQYENIFRQCYDMLADNRFLVVKICEIRDKKTGEYRNFVGDNIDIFKRIGFKYYNEIILLNSPGSLPLRAGKSMNASRKIGKRHQNLLVFYKGNMNAIKEIFPDIIPANDYYKKEENE